MTICILALLAHGVPRPVTALARLALGFAFWALIERPALTPRFPHALSRQRLAPLRIEPVAVALA